MTLVEKIDQDFKSALKNRDASKIGVLRLLKSALKNKAVEKQSELTDADVLLVLKSEAKKRKESIEAFKKAERNDLVDQETQELKVLSEYLPEDMTADQIREKIAAVMQQFPDADQSSFGQVMGAVMKELAGQADGQVVGQLVKEALAQQK